MKNQTVVHPPLQKGEKFIGNRFSDELPEYLQNISGLRIVGPAYDIMGNILPRHFAMLATQSAANEYNKIMDAKMRETRLGFRK